jgi:hypothetical protein
METFKQFMAFPLYATVAYLVWVLAGQTSEGGMLTALLGLVLIAMGVWFYGRWNAPGASAGRARFGLIAGALVFGLGAWIGWPQPPAPTEIVWEKWSEEGRREIPRRGPPVYVDFTARWCATCQTNKGARVQLLGGPHLFRRPGRSSRSRPTGPTRTRRSPPSWPSTSAAPCPSTSSGSTPAENFGRVVENCRYYEPVLHQTLPELLTPKVVRHRARRALKGST